MRKTIRGSALSMRCTVPFTRCIDDGASDIFSPTVFFLLSAACLLVYVLYASLASRLRAVEVDFQMRLNKLETLLTRVLDLPAPGPSRRLELLITKLVDSTEQRRQNGRNATLPKPCSDFEISADRCSDRTGNSLRSANGETVPLATQKTSMGKLFFPPRTVPTNGPGRVSPCSLNTQSCSARPASVPQVAASPSTGSSRGVSVQLSSQPRRPAASMVQASATSLSGSSSSSPARSKQFTVTVEEALRMLEAFETSGTLDYFTVMHIAKGRDLYSHAIDCMCPGYPMRYHSLHRC